MRVTDFMNFITKLNFTILFLPSILVFTVIPCMSEVNEPGTIVLTFDDSVASHATFVAPLLKKYGFGATFFITEGFDFAKDKKNYMTWEQIRKLHDDGFEIGNHTRRHISVGRQTEEQLHQDIEYIEKQCKKHGIPKPISFCYPAYQTTNRAVRVLKSRGYQFARAGGSRAYDATKDDPLLIPQAFDGKPKSSLEQFKEAASKAKDGKVSVMTFHGVPDIQHPWVNTEPEKFKSYMDYLKQSGYKVIALRDLKR